jgi:predicted dehydrogenase
VSSNPIRLGFIGLNPDTHWAATAHIPALAALRDRYEIVGVANSSPESSRRTADVLGLPHAFLTAEDLVSSSNVDMVVVTVKVPHHLELVTAALEAGKHVYCEWPLGNGLNEARQLAALAATKGVVAAVGTQARAAVEIEYLRDLVADGYLGKVRSTTLLGSGGNWADETTADYAYLFDASNGATMQSIPLAHTLAAVVDVLGPIANLSARLVNQFETVIVTDTGEVREKSTPDQIMIDGVFESGAALSVHYRGGVSRGTNLLWEINGTEGDIQVTGESGHAQITQLSISGARGETMELQSLNPPAEHYMNWPKTSVARNVARMYARIADDIRDGTRKAPSFEDALKLHELVDRIERSAAKAP